MYLITPVEPLRLRFWGNSEIACYIVVNNNKYLSYVVDDIILGISALITQVEPLKPRFWDNSEIICYLVVNNNKYLSFVVDNFIFGFNVPDYPSKAVGSNSLG